MKFQKLASLAVGLLVLLAIVFCAAPTQAGDWSKYSATQFWFKVIPDKGVPLSRNYDGWQLYGKALIVTIPRYGVYQPNGYLGFRKGGLFLYLGNSANWHGKDPLMLGVIKDYPTGRFVLSTEIDVMPTGDWIDWYNWSGIDMNFDAFGEPFWLGIQAETLVFDGHSSTEGGFRLGWGAVENALYVGDKGWDARFIYTWRP